MPSEQLNSDIRCPAVPSVVQFKIRSFSDNRVSQDVTDPRVRQKNVNGFVKTKNRTHTSHAVVHSPNKCRPSSRGHNCLNDGHQTTEGVLSGIKRVGRRPAKTVQTNDSSRRLIVATEGGKHLDANGPSPSDSRLSKCCFAERVLKSLIHLFGRRVQPFRPWALVFCLE